MEVFELIRFIKLRIKFEINTKNEFDFSASVVKFNCEV